MIKDTDYVLMEDYSADMEKMREMYKCAIEYKNEEIKQLRDLMTLILDQSGKTVKIPLEDIANAQISNSKKIVWYDDAEHRVRVFNTL